MLIGNPGGTVIVIKSINFKTIDLTEHTSWIWAIKIIYDIMEKTNKNNKNIVDCFWN